MKICVAIPTHKPDLKDLERCLVSIENQTRKPDIVSISASSCTEEDLESLHLTKYLFQIIHICTPNSQNAAQNRNCAAKLVEDKDIDIICFFDSDDEMLPERLEYLEKAFSETFSKLIVHNFIHITNPEQKIERSQNFTEYSVFPNVIISNGWGCRVNFEECDKNFAHGHVSTLYSIWKEMPFREEPSFLYREDAEFCRAIASKYIECSYIQTQLSVYHQY